MVPVQQGEWITVMMRRELSGISGTAELCPLCMNDRFQSGICVHAYALFGKDAGRDDSGYRELRTGEVKLVVRVSSLKASLSA